MSLSQECILSLLRLEGEGRDSELDKILICSNRDVRKYVLSYYTLECPEDIFINAVDKGDLIIAKEYLDKIPVGYRKNTILTTIYRLGEKGRIDDAKDILVMKFRDGVPLISYRPGEEFVYSLVLSPISSDINHKQFGWICGYLSLEFHKSVLELIVRLNKPVELLRAQLSNMGVDKSKVLFVIKLVFSGINLDYIKFLFKEWQCTKYLSIGNLLMGKRNPIDPPIKLTGNDERDIEILKVIFEKEEDDLRDCMSSFLGSRIYIMYYSLPKDNKIKIKINKRRVFLKEDGEYTCLDGDVQIDLSRMNTDDLCILRDITGLSINTLSNLDKNCIGTIEEAIDNPSLVGGDESLKKILIDACQIELVDKRSK